VPLPSEGAFVVRAVPEPLGEGSVTELDALPVADGMLGAPVDPDGLPGAWVPLPRDGAFVVDAVPEPLGEDCVGEAAPPPPTEGLLLPLGAGMLLVPAGGALVWALSPWVTVAPGGQS
jgi:hypothetical protein